MNNNNWLGALALLAGLLCCCTIHAMVTMKLKLPHPLLTKRLLEEIFYRQPKSYFTQFPADITKNYILPMTLQCIEMDRDAYTRQEEEAYEARLNSQQRIDHRKWKSVDEELVACLNSSTISQEEKKRKCIE